MKFGGKILNVILICSVALSFNANASLDYSFTDWKVDGDNLVTVVEQTGFEFLNLSQTATLTYNEVIAETGFGGEFEGWTLPSYDQMLGFQQVFYPDSFYPEITSEYAQVYYDNVSHILDAFGDSTNSGLEKRIQSQGSFASNVDNKVSIFGFREFDILTSNTSKSSRVYINLSYHDFTYDRSFDHGGVYLMRESSQVLSISNISAPILGGFALSILSLLVFSKNKFHDLVRFIITYSIKV